MKLIGYILCAVGCMIVAIGRIKGIHLTEGEAFVQLWYYWLFGLLTGAGGIILCSKGDK